MTGLAIETLIMAIDSSSSWTTPFRGRLVQVAFVLFIIKILGTKNNVKEWIWIAALLGIGMISYLTCREELVIRALAFVLASKGINTKRAVQIIFYTILTSTIIIVVLALTGVCGQVYEVRHFGRGMEEIRYNLGFNHANNVHDMLWVISLLYIMLRQKRYCFWEMLAISAANVGLYSLTVSRTGFIVTELIVTGCFIVNLLDYKLVKLSVHIMTLVLLGLSVGMTLWCARYMPYLYPSLKKIDGILTGRLEMVFERAQLINWEIMPMSFNSPDVDNGFAFIGYSYGYIILALLIISIIWLANRLYTNHQTDAEILLLSVIFVIYMETTFIINVSLVCNILLVLLIVYGMNNGTDNNNVIL